MKAKLVKVAAVLWAKLADLVLGKFEGELANFSGCAEGGLVPGRNP